MSRESEQQRVLNVLKNELGIFKWYDHKDRIEELVRVSYNKGYADGYGDEWGLCHG